MEYVGSAVGWQNGIPLSEEGIATFMDAGLAHNGHTVGGHDLTVQMTSPYATPPTSTTPMTSVDAKPMPVRDKVAWLALLRDPDAKQARRRLTVMDDQGVQRHCCWGLYCQVMGVPVSRVSEINPEEYPDDYRAGTRQVLTYSFVTQEVYEDESSIPTDYAMAHGVDTRVTGVLEMANDAGFSFALIASWIERYL